MSDFFFDKIELAATDSARVAEKVHSHAIREIAEIYATNIKTTLNLMAFPLVLLGTGIGETSRLTFFVEAMIATKNTTKWHESDDAKREVDAEVNRRFMESGGKSTVITEAKHWLRHLADRQEIANSLQILLYTGVVWIWLHLRR